MMFDYEQIKQYVVRLYVTDLGDLLGENISSSGLDTYQSVTDLPSDHVDFIDVTVNVIDENDNHPIFVDGVTAYSFNVIEEQSNGTFVGTVKVRKVQSSYTYTVHVMYSSYDMIPILYRLQIKTMVYLVQ